MDGPDITANVAPHQTADRSGTAEPGNLTAQVRASLENQRLEHATALVLAWAERRIRSGDEDARAIEQLLRHYILLVCRMPPLAHLEREPLRPDDRLYECFDDIVTLLHRQDQQINTLLAMLAELV
jgi:hypothetical protein